MSQCISRVMLLGHLVRGSLLRAGNGSRWVLQHFSWSLFNLLFDSLLNPNTHKARGQVLSPWELKALPCRALLICQKKTIGPGQVLVESSSVIAQWVSILSLQSRQEPIRTVLWIPQPWVGPDSAPRSVLGTQLQHSSQLLHPSSFLHMSPFCLARRSDEGFKTKRIPFFTTKSRVRCGPEAGKVHSSANAGKRVLRMPGELWSSSSLWSLAGGK